MTNLSEQEQNELITIKAASEGFPEYCVAIDPRYTLEWFHSEIAFRLEEAVKQIERGEDVRLMIFMPPRHGKSDEATQKFPSWVLGKHPEWPFIIASYSQDLATDFGQGTRDLMERPNYKAIFNTRLREDTSAKAKWMTDQGGGYTAVGVGGAITGRGFKIGIVDDPFKNREEADSPVTRESVHKWWRSTFYTRQEGNTCMILILTRWHDDDLAGRLLKEQIEAEKNGDENIDKWEVLEFKALAEEDGKKRLKGEALWPAKFDVSKLLKTKAALGSYEFSALYQQNPIDEESQEFKKDWLQYRTWEEVQKMQCRKFATIDPAGSKKKTSDNTGVTRNYVNALNEWNIKSKRYRINSKGIIDLIFTLHDEGFEQIGIEEGVYSDAIEPFLKEKMDELNIYPNVVPLKHKGVMKETRIRGLIPRYESKKVFHISGECDDLEEEYLRFPKSAHDDCLDTTAYQNQIAVPPSMSVGDIVTIDEVEKAFSKDLNLQETTYIIGVSSALPVTFVVGNKQGLFYYATTADPLKDIGQLMSDWKNNCYVFSDQVGDVLWLKELQSRYIGKVYTCYLRNDPKSQELIKWGSDQRLGEVEISRSAFIQQILDEIRGNTDTSKRFTINGKIEQWQPFIKDWTSLYRLWTEDTIGTRIGTWESNTPQQFIKSTLYFRTALSRFGLDKATFIKKDDSVRFPIGSKTNNTIPGRQVLRSRPRGYVDF